jgi:AraC-like DNA-binding protein
MNNLPIKQTAFNNERISALGIEPIRFHDLLPKLEKGTERVEFYMLILVTGGEGSHRVDFIDYKVSKGTLLFVRPGQVQEWGDYSRLEGDVVLIDPQSLPYDAMLPSVDQEGLALIRWQNVVTLPEILYQDTANAVLRLHRDFSNYDGSTLDIALIRHELLSLLLRLARWQSRVSPMAHTQGRAQKTYRLFAELLEREYIQQHSLSFYAQRLGYAQSTLSRACVRFEGVTGKVMIDKRIVLEAQRLLVHSAMSVAEVGYYLGFSEATNFVKFFKRMLGMTPQAFRESRRVSSPLDSNSL